jgi:hypothetical protein
VAPGGLIDTVTIGHIRWNEYDLIPVAHVQPFGLPCPTGGVHWCRAPEDDNVRHFILRSDDMWDLDTDSQT